MSLSSLRHLLVRLELLESCLKFIRKGVTNTGHSLQRGLKDLVCVDLASIASALSKLYSHIADGLARMRHRVRTELYVLVLDDLIAKQVA